MKALITRWLNRPAWPLLLGVVAIVVTLPALRTGFVADDYVHRAAFLGRPGFAVNPLEMFSFVKGGPDRVEALRRIALPWWSADDLKLAFWRPVTAVTHALDYALWPDSAWLMHVHSVLWYAAVVVVVAVLFGQLLPVRWQAGLAAFIYAVSHSHAVPVFFIANRNALLGVCFGAVALLFHHRGRQSARRDVTVLAPVALLLGLLSNEGAVAAVAYLFAYAVFIDTGTWRERARSLLPYVAVVIAWRLVYQLQGYGASASEAYVDPVASPSAFLSAVVTRAPMYLLSQWLLPPTDWSRVVSSAVLVKWQVLAIGFLVVLCAFLFPLLRRDRTARFWFAGMLLSVIPSCATFPMDRMLLYSGIGGAALIAQVAGAVAAGDLVPATARVRRMLVRVSFDIVIALHVVLAPVWLPVFIVTTANGFDTMTDGIEKLAVRDDLSRKLVVLIDDATFSGAYFGALRAVSGRDPVDQWLVLAPVEGRLDWIVLRRPSADTLVMETEGRYRWFIERDSAHPFAVGDSVAVHRVKIDVQRVSPDGRPTRVAFHFDTSLDDDSIAWFGRLEDYSNSAFPTGGYYPRWTPPPVGGAVSVK
jgi:hypothetical protein